MDLKEECSISESQSSSSNSNGNSSGNSNSNSNINSNGELKKCTDCQTTTTPLWRGGPAGPKTLCNACGIKFHKKRRALLGINQSKVEKCKKKSNNISNNMNNNNIMNHSNKNGIGMPLKIKVMASGIRQSDKLGEVEQAAMLLMALSYGSVYA